MSNVTNDSSGFLSNEQLSPKHQRQLDEYLAQTPIAEVHVRLFGLDRGQSEVRVQSSPGAELAALDAIGPERASAYAQLLACLHRELQDALTTLSNH